jgi:cytidylate kinase
MIVTVDGPSGTGKSTVSRAVAQQLGLPHLDTGAFYRAATLAVLEAGESPEDANTVTSIVEEADIDQVDGTIRLNGRDVTDAIRQDPVNRHVSAVSSHPEVRRLLVERQRRWVATHGGSAVVEGRDIGSVVFPTAPIKIYLDARPEIRASRRAAERDMHLDDVAEALRRRDHLDTSRAASPLLVPKDAVVVDTSEMKFRDVVDLVISLATRGA